MQNPTSVALLSAIYAFALAAAGSLPRGVSPEFAAHYQDKDSFTCITDAAIKLSLSQVNDNSCDCPDGSDEPGTAACANVDRLSPEQPVAGTTNALPGFWCANEGHIGMYVPFSFVNDGICDYDICCDGTEEYGGIGGVKCENKCDEIGKEYRRLEEEKRKNMEKAAKRRDALLKEAQALRQKIEAKVSGLKTEIGILEARRDKLARKHREAEQQAKGKVVGGEGGGGKLGVLVGLAKTRVNELRDTLNNVVDQRDALKDRVGELEELLTKFQSEYNPNFNDEGVKSALRSFEGYSARVASEKGQRQDVNDADVLSVLREDSETNGVNWNEFEQGDGCDTDIIYNLEAYLPSFARSFLRNSFDSLRVWLATNGIVADNAGPGQESTLVRAAREALEAAERDVEKKVKSLRVEETELDKDYGPENLFRALQGKCFSLEAGEYTYEHCWMDKTMQKSKKGHGHSSMGFFSRIDHGIADDDERLDGKSLGKGERIVLRYENGQQCWNGPKRRTDVWLGCSETEELWRVSESEKCVYKMEVGTPAACDFQGAPAGQAFRGKDEL